jgi:hypothetical protein
VSVWVRAFGVWCSGSKGLAVCDRAVSGLFGEVVVAVGEAQSSKEEKKVGLWLPSIIYPECRQCEGAGLAS